MIDGTTPNGGGASKRREGGAALASIARKALREPFVIFFGISTIIFGAYSIANDDREEIVVSEAVVDQLAEDQFLLTGIRPDAAARQALIDNYVREEILFREGLRRGLHLNDSRIRERIIEKLQFLLSPTVADPEPAELLEYYVNNRDRYRTEPQATIEHVYFQEEPEHLAEILKRLDSGEKVKADEFWLGARFEHYDESVIRHVFGPEFGAAAFSEPIETWSGPYWSPRGVHFMKVEQRWPSQPLEFAQIEGIVAEDWRRDRRQAALDEELRAMRRNFEIIIPDEE